MKNRLAGIQKIQSGQIDNIYDLPIMQVLQNEVKKYQPEIYQRVTQRIEKDRQFKKYGIPMSFLELSDATLLRDFSMELIFELKERKL